MMGYYYDTQIIYGDTREDQMTHFSWDGETYYRTPKGKPKKVNKIGKKVGINEEEFQNAQQHYNSTFGTSLKL